MELAASLFSLLILLGVLVFFVITAVTWTPYVPTPEARVKAMLALARPRAGERMADLGSGDGRIVMAFARLGVEAHGYELNPLLVLWANLKIRLAGLQGKAFIHLKSFWKEDVSQFDVITLYCMQRTMPDFEKKFRSELRPGARVLSHKFVFTDWEPAETLEQVSLYVR